MANIKQTKVNSNAAVVGLSGGVDSAVASALLQNKGQKLYGVYIKGFGLPGIKCPEEQDIRDARLIASNLGIHFEVVNEGSKLYQQEVYDDFIGSYLNGTTPNPDVRCNGFVKFPFLRKLKDEYEADKIVTGHYFRKIADRFFTAKDAKKDQSYFLWRVPREILLECEFPIGELIKSEVRKLAGNFGLHVAQKPGTRGVCMVGEISIPEVLEDALRERGIRLEYARAVLLDGASEIELGKIPARVFYAATIGQRNGFGLSYKFPIYVVRKDVKKAVLYFEILPRGVKKFSVSSVNWLCPDADSFRFPMRLLVKIRTPGKMLYAKLVKHSDKILEVLLDDPDHGVTPGQSAVFYRKAEKSHTELLGGGVIQ